MMSDLKDWDAAIASSRQFHSVRIIDCELVGQKSVYDVSIEWHDLSKPRLFNSLSGWLESRGPVNA